MERETKKITTPSGKAVELKTYLTAGEAKELSLVFLKGMKLDYDAETKKPIVKDISGSLINEAENRAIELIVVSFDGSNENILGRLLELKSTEFDFVMEEINKITKPIDEKKEAAFKSDLEKETGKITVLSSETVGPTLGR